MHHYPSFEADLEVLDRDDHSSPPPSNSESSKQKSWDSPLVKAAFNSLLNSASDLTSPVQIHAAARKESGAWIQAAARKESGARIQAAARKESGTRIHAAARMESGAWIYVLPMSSLGFSMDEDIIRVAIGLQLRTPLCHLHICHQCGSRLDQLGTHGLNCSKCLGCHSRHTANNDIVRHSLASIKVPSHLEPSSICRSDGKNPDGTSIVSWMNVVFLWDITCVDTFAPSYAS